MLNKVVVTGIGSVNPLGLSVPETWENIVAGKSGICSFHAKNPDIQIHVAGLIDDERLYSSQVISKQDLKQYDTFIHYGLYAADEAMRDSGLDLEKTDSHRIGVCMGSGIGGISLLSDNIDKLTQRGPRRVSPYLIPGMLINMLPGAISLKYGAHGLNYSAVSACSSSAHAIALAMRHIQMGDADVIIAGGAEMATADIGVAGFAALRALSKSQNPETASRPWDKSRDGFVMSNGAAVLILESESHAKARKAKIYAECAGMGMSSDAYNFVQPDPSGNGAARAVKQALASARCDLADIDYINAHATSTPVGDPIEIHAIESIDREAAKKLVMSSTKSMHGHLLGAAGALECLVSIKAIEQQCAPATINCDDVDFDTPIDLVRHHAQERRIQTVLSNSFGFGGTNVALILREYVNK